MRLFVALDLPDHLRERLRLLAGGLPGARWVPAENYHLTLRFIGEVPPYRAEEVDEALAALRAPAFPLVLAGTGAFGKGDRANALWAAVQRSEPLDRLQAKIETALQRVGLEPERRRWAPHVTLARLDGVAEEKLAAWMHGNNLFRAQPFPVEHFTLFSSQLSKDHPVYTAEAEYALAAQD